MASSIGGYSFNKFNGAISHQATRIETLDRPGVDGSIFIDFGSKAPPSIVISSVDVDTLAAVDSTMDNYRTKQGTLVSVVDSDGVTHSNVLVHSVEQIGSSVVVAASAGGSTSTPEAVLTARWTLQATD